MFLIIKYSSKPIRKRSPKTGREHEQAVHKRKTFKWLVNKLKTWGLIATRAQDWNNDYPREAKEPFDWKAIWLC